MKNPVSFTIENFENFDLGFFAQMGSEPTAVHVTCCLLSLVRTCFVAPKFSGPEGEPRPASLVPKVDYPLDGGRILRIEGQIRYS